MRHPFKAAAIVGIGFSLASFAPLPGFSTAALDALDPSRLAGLNCGAQRAGSALAQNLLVAAAMAAGIPVKEILEDYPSLTEDKLELAALYAEANPLRGRPKPVIAALPKGTRVISDHRLPRRRAG